MRRMLITIYFDIEDDLADEKRDFDRFIIEVEPEDYRRRIFEVFDEKRYSWDDYKKFKRGFKAIMSINQLDLTDLELITEKLSDMNNSREEDLLEELELEA